MPHKKKNAVDQPGVLEARFSTAPCAPGIGDKVKGWRDGGSRSSNFPKNLEVRGMLVRGMAEGVWPMIPLTIIPLTSLRPFS